MPAFPHERFPGRPVKALLLLAGKGTRLRPHTHATPKPLLRVAGKPVLDYLLDDLTDAGVSEVVFVVGHLGDAVRDHVARRRPRIRARYVVQEVQDGTAGAVALARPWADDELLIVLADAVFEVDLGAARRLPPEKAGLMWAMDVEDYQRFGVIVTDDAGDLARIVEKPKEPVSKRANIGLYYVRDHAMLFEGVAHVLASDPGPSGEYYLTDAFQYMVDRGAKIATAVVDGWHDAGKPETLLETSRHLLGRDRGGVADEARVRRSRVSPVGRIEAGAVVEGSRLGDNVTVETGARVADSDLEDVIVGAEAVVERCRLRRSIVGSGAVVRGVAGSVRVADHAEVLSQEP